MKTIGVVGQGFVGGAVASAFSTNDKQRVETYDKYIPARSTKQLPELVDVCDVIFVCVPSPSNEDGSCDTSIVESVVGDIATCAKSKKVVVIKSTIPPGTTDMLNVRYRGSHVDVVFNPEFLNARSALEDFIGQKYIILGGDKESCEIVADAYSLLFPDIKPTIVPAKTAETVKYVKNTFFAAKVSFFNEMYQICQALDVNYDEMIDVAKLDDRIGWEHLKVPGPTPGVGPWEGQKMFGYGGPCLCKDTQAFQHLAKKLGIDTKMLDASWAKNLEVRPQRDWEYIKGSAPDSTIARRKQREKKPKDK